MNQDFNNEYIKTQQSNNQAKKKCLVLLMVLVLLMIIVIGIFVLSLFSNNEQETFNREFGKDNNMIDVCAVHTGGNFPGTDKEVEYLFFDNKKKEYNIGGYSTVDNKIIYKYIYPGTKMIDKSNYVKENFGSYKNIYIKYLQSISNTGDEKRSQFRMIVGANNYNIKDITAIKNKISMEKDEYGIDIYFVKKFDSGKKKIYEKFLISQYADLEDCRKQFGEYINHKHNNIFVKGKDEDGYTELANYTIHHYSKFDDEENDMSLQEYINNSFNYDVD